MAGGFSNRITRITCRVATPGAIEGVTGVLTFGWSTGVIFAIAGRLLAIRTGQTRLKPDQEVLLEEKER